MFTLFLKRVFHVAGNAGQLYPLKWAKELKERVKKFGHVWDERDTCLKITILFNGTLVRNDKEYNDRFPAMPELIRRRRKKDGLSRKRF